MNWYVKRTGQALFTLWAVVTISFALAWYVPTDVVETFVTRAGSEPGTNPQQIREALEEYLMFDHDATVWDAYATYMGEVLTGNFGYSIVAGTDINGLLAETVPWTLLVMSIATLGMFALSLTLGAIMAYREGSYFDLTNTGVGILTTSIPYWVAALLLIMTVGYNNIPLLEPITQYFPVRGTTPHEVDPGFTFEFVSGALRHATLPALSFILTGYGLLALSMRANSIQILGDDFVRVAELRGLPRRRIALRYVGRNAVLPLYTSLLLAIGFMLGGSVVLEEIFAYRGVGYYMYLAVDDGDVPLMVATFMVITVAVVIATFIADLTYGKLDPRIKSGDQGEAF